MIILDTNVVSDALQLRPSASVAAWLNAQIPSELHTTATTEAELRSGVAQLPQGKRRRDLLIAVNAVLSRHFAERILPFDSAAAVAFADIGERRRAMGRPIAQFDAQIAAICRVYGATLATRNVADFAEIGLKLVNPWGAK